MRRDLHIEESSIVPASLEKSYLGSVGGPGSVTRRSLYEGFHQPIRVVDAVAGETNANHLYRFSWG